MAKFVGFASIFPVFTTDLIGLHFLPEGVHIWLFFFCCLLCFSQRDLRQFSFLPVPVDFTFPFFFSPALYGQTVMIFYDPGLKNLASLIHHHHHHVSEGLGMLSCSLILMKLVPPPLPWSSRVPSSFGLYYNACFGSLFVSIFCTCCSHFFWYCFISFTILCAPVFSLIY